MDLQAKYKITKLKKYKMEHKIKRNVRGCKSFRFVGLENFSEMSFKVALSLPFHNTLALSKLTKIDVTYPTLGPNRALNSIVVHCKSVCIPLILLHRREEPVFARLSTGWHCHQPNIFAIVLWVFFSFYFLKYVRVYTS